MNPVQTITRKLLEAFGIAGGGENPAFAVSPPAICGKLFVFHSEFGSHEIIILGSIKGVMFSDEGGLELHVSCPEFWGVPLRSLIFTQRGWAALINDPKATDPSDRLFPGDLVVYW